MSVRPVKIPKVYSVAVANTNQPEESSVSDIEPIRYGIVGLGRSGWDIHVAALRDRADARIVAVADPLAEYRQQAEAELPGCKAYDSLGKLLKNPDVEVVVIATPSVQHAADTKRSLKAQRHVVCEKPMAISLAETDSVIKAAKASGWHLFIHQNYRFWPEFNHLQDVVNSGILGKLFHIRHYQTAFARRNDWQTLAKNGGGVLNNTCPHFIDVLIRLIDSPIKQVMGDLKQIASGGDVEDHVKILMRGENGVTADLEISQAESLPTPLPKWILCGTHGTLSSDGKQSTIRWFDPSQVDPLPIPVVEGPARGRRYGNDDKLPWQQKTVPVEGADKRNFYDNVTEVLRQGKPMRVPLEQVRQIMQIIALARRGTGGWLVVSG
jgi:predicted dehydrogenase